VVQVLRRTGYKGEQDGHDSFSQVHAIRSAINSQQ
jgi:hypothetical protein